MKKQFVINLILLGSFITTNAQIYTPNGIIQGSSGNNNVGIGTTTTPSYKLEVKSPGPNGVILASRSSTDKLIGFLYESGSGHGEFYLRDATGSDNYVRITSSGSSYFLGGNLGIGTPSPGYALTIKGSYYSPQAVISYDGANGIFFHAQGTSSHYNWLIGQQRTADASLEFTPSTAQGGTIFSTPVMVIKANGKVGVGTTSPIGQFHIVDNTNISGGPPNGTTPTQGMLLGANSTIGVMNMGIDGTGNFYSWIQSRSKNSPEFYNLALNPYGGNVGIGTTNPQTLLNVNVGGGGSNGTTGIRVGGLTNYPSLELGIDGDYNGMIRSYGNNINYYAGHWRTIGATATENHSHNWYTSKAGSTDWSTIKMVLNQDGNLGIGIADPGNYKLNVWGKIRAHEVVVNTTGADFVFDHDYKLLGLSEVEDFIKENNHLPDIPSSEAMQENGMNMSEMQTKLLQKIEELTLYIIELNKKIEVLESEKY